MFPRLPCETGSAYPAQTRLLIPCDHCRRCGSTGRAIPSVLQNRVLPRRHCLTLSEGFPLPRVTHGARSDRAHLGRGAGHDAAAVPLPRPGGEHSWLGDLPLPRARTRAPTHWARAALGLAGSFRPRSCPIDRTQVCSQRLVRRPRGDSRMSPTGFPPHCAGTQPSRKLHAAPPPGRGLRFCLPYESRTHSSRLEESRWVRMRATCRAEGRLRIHPAYGAPGGLRRPPHGPRCRSSPDPMAQFGSPLSRYHSAVESTA